MKIKLSLLSLCLFLVLQIGTAQIDVGRMAKKTENTIEKKISKSVSKGIKNLLNSAEDEVTGKKKRKKKKGYEDDDYRSEPEVIREVSPYSFEGTLTIDVNNGDSENMIQVGADEMKFAVRPMFVKKPNNLMIYNKEEQSITKINNEEYKGKALKEFYEYEATDAKKSKTEFEKTSEFEEIHGFLARKYLVDGKGFKGEVWMAPELDLDYDLFAKMMDYEFLGLGVGYGFPLIINIEFKDDTTYRFNVSKIETDEVNEKLFNVKKYKLIDMTDLESGN